MTSNKCIWLVFKEWRKRNTYNTWYYE